MSQTGSGTPKNYTDRFPPPFDSGEPFLFPLCTGDLPFRLPALLFLLYSAERPVAPRSHIPLRLLVAPNQRSSLDFPDMRPFGVNFGFVEFPQTVHLLGV